MLTIYYFVGHLLLSGTMVTDGNIAAIEDMGEQAETTKAQTDDQENQDVESFELIHERPKGKPTGRDLIKVNGPSVTVCLGPGDCGEDEEYVLFEDPPYCLFELGTDTDLWKRMEGIFNRINLFSETFTISDYPSHDTLMVVYWQGGGARIESDSVLTVDEKLQEPYTYSHRAWIDSHSLKYLTGEIEQFLPAWDDDPRKCAKKHAWRYIMGYYDFPDKVHNYDGEEYILEPH